MDYMLLIASDTQPGEPAARPDEIQDWIAEGEQRGIGICGDPLVAPSEAVTVRVRDGAVLTTDGPYTESKEWIVGYDIIRCTDLDQAIDYVSRHPMARRGRIEIRPLLELESVTGTGS